jgi:pyridoxine 5-phosphate synthase
LLIILISKPNLIGILKTAIKVTRLSVNINKIATLRNARGGNNPDVLRVAMDCERFGAEGITVHPRPDERHIRFADAIQLKQIVKTEYNIEGYPDERYLQIIQMTAPAQATLVPDAPDAITSNAGWNTIKNKSFLTEIVAELKKNNVRVSVFVDPDPKMIEGAAKVGADRVELYTEPYAQKFHIDKEEAIKAYIESARVAKSSGLGINAGHDLDLDNLRFLKNQIPFLDEVSIGHALICDALYLGLENAIQLYLQQLRD